MKHLPSILGAAALLFAGLAPAPSVSADQTPGKTAPGMTADVKPATSFTAKANASVYGELDFGNRQEHEFATRGLIDAPEKLELKDESGRIIWSQAAYAFLDKFKKAPESANPSLWENTVNNHAYGLFKVVDGIYQVRGYDMANLTVVRGRTGWIVFDTTMCVECSRAAMELIEKNLGKFPVKAVIISHPHVDHYGGIAGVMDKEDRADPSQPIEQQLAGGKIPIIVPKGFTEHAVKENVYAGKAMSRRANYQYGVLLTPGPEGRLAQGIGMGQSTGTVSFMAPTFEITKTGEKITIDGVELEFQLTPGTEAPAEMNTWIPKYRALWVAENCTATLHNLYTLRGAEVRDGAAWAGYITNMISLPKALAANWYTRPYYGTVSHDSRAVYQKFMGWYDGNPVHLNPLMPTARAQKWVEYLGSTDKVLAKARKDFEKGEYRWVAEITNTLVFADPKNTAARLLCADALEQLGYQSESGPWRNEYLSAALELRNGNTHPASPAKGGNDQLMEQTAPMIFDYMAIVLNKEALQDADFVMNVTLPDVNEKHMLRVKNGVLLVFRDTLSDSPDVSITCPKNALFGILSNDRDAVAKNVKVEGKAELLTLLMKNMMEFPIRGSVPFNIVEP